MDRLGRKSALCLLLISSAVNFALTDSVYKLCYLKDITSDECNALKRGDSRVECVKALDMAHCAILMNEGKADFGVFTAEGLLLAHQFYPDKLMVVADLRHREHQNETFEFESVAVAALKNNSQNVNLRGVGFCHPGFNDHNIWNDYILKFFEKETYGRGKCQYSLSVVENDLYHLRQYFGKACRPGKWVLNDTLDAKFKRKYSELCALCDNKSSCNYNDTDHHGHFGALDCLTNGQGGVAYVALRYVNKYFEKKNSSLNLNDYKFVCPQGNTQSLNFNLKPCSWIKQPWNSVVVRKEISDQFIKELKLWNQVTVNDWRRTLLDILQKRKVIKIVNAPISSEMFLSRGRNISPPTQTCGKEIRWCTLNDMETSKCKWLAAEAANLGIEPKITCKQTIKLDRSLIPLSRENSLFQCFFKIAHNEADVMTVDANYGSVVRQVYNLSNVLYCGTNKEDYSTVIAMVKEESTNAIKNFSDLKNRKACFPEFGGIAWLSFLNTARQMGLISKCCNYPKIVADFFSGACVPGINEVDRQNKNPGSNVIKKLCSICHSHDNDDTRRVCNANDRNEYYGVLGAVKCLKEGLGDVAFIEVQHLRQNLSYYNLDPTEYRVICKNGSLATYTGFDVDDQCALSVTIDSEVVSRRKNLPVETANIKSVFLKIEDWMGYRPSELRPIRIYEPFNNTNDLLFKSSTNALVDSSSSYSAIDAYKDIMLHVDMCTGSASVTSVLSLTAFLIALLMSTQM